MTIRLLIADDHEVVRSGLVALLAGSGIEVVGEAASGEEAVERTRELAPQAVLMDIRMVEGDGISALERLRQETPATAVVMLSTYDNPTYIARSLALGASDYVLKGSPRHQIVVAIERAVRGDTPAEDSVMLPVRDTMKKRPKPTGGLPLTKRELQVLRHLALGLSNKEIGQSLAISVETVKEHVQNILRKLDATDRTQVAVWAVRQGLA